jgi:hypothetical protein
MLDFETLGQSADTAVLSLGAVIFTRDAFIETRYWSFSLHGQIASGKRTVNADTLLWWLGQGDGAKRVFQESNDVGTLLKDFAPPFVAFVKKAGSDVRVWSNGATFDIPIIEHILSQQGQPVPWKFWNQRCYRTMKACFGIDKKFEGVKHNALDDSKHQANCLMEYWAKNPSADK